MRVRRGRALAGVLSAGFSCASVSRAGSEPLPLVIVTADNTLLDRSCRVQIAPGAVIADGDGDGVIQIGFDDGVVEFAEGSILRGSAAGVDPDACNGVGIRINGHRGVTIRNARIEGFKVGLLATAADRLSLEGCRFENLWRQRLKSSIQAEDQGDWLWPHANDQHEWRLTYGGAACIENSVGVTVRGCVARGCQNGLILDRVTSSRVFDNDFSFLSGWGLALWRSSANMIAGNALDFCIRGYSHGVYNRGQDSAGILCFEQSSGNTFIQNSATHCGDGFFGFAGKEALGEAPPSADAGAGFDYTRRGCNDNLLIENDFSYSAAHGVEMTFSFGNQILRNRLIGNGICGFWGGYSQQTLFQGNHVVDNGRKGAREGGGVNTEHGLANVYAENVFAGEAVGISLWCEENRGILRTAWAGANHRGSRDNVIDSNRFEGPGLAVKLASDVGTLLRGNLWKEGALPEDQIQRQPATTASDEPKGMPVPERAPERAAPARPGDARPVGERDDLGGREAIIMGPWGPWDHQSALLREVDDQGFQQRYELRKLPDGDLSIEVEQGDSSVQARLEMPGDDEREKTLGLAAVSAEPGVHPFAIRVKIGELDWLLEGVLVNWRWNIRFFAYESDPRVNLEAWRAESRGAGVSVQANGLKLPFGMGGPSQLGLSDELGAANLPANHFGTIAETVVPLPPGRWRIRTLSDDGVRVKVSTSPLGGPGLIATPIENWTHHGPTRDQGEFVIPRRAPAGPVGDAIADEPTPTAIRVEHFELDGFAVLELTLERVDEAGKP